MKLQIRPLWLIAIIFCITRLSTWFYPFGSDHWIFFYVGKDWLEGGKLYVTAWDHKGPLIFAFNAILAWIFGNNLIWHRIVFTLLAIFDTFLFYKVTQKIFQKTETVWTSTAFYAFWRNLSQFTSSGNNTENLTLIFLLLGYLWFFKSVEDISESPIFKTNIAKLKKSLRDEAGLIKGTSLNFVLLSGLSLSVVFLLKPNFIILFFPLVLYSWVIYRRSLLSFMAITGSLILPSILHLFLWIMYFKWQDSLHDFLLAAFTFNSKYWQIAWQDKISHRLIFILINLVFLSPIFLILADNFLQIFTKNKHFLSNRIQNFNSLRSSFLSFAVILGLLYFILTANFYPYYLLPIIPFCVWLTVDYFSKIRLGILKKLFHFEKGLFKMQIITKEWHTLFSQSTKKQTSFRAIFFLFTIWLFLLSILGSAAVSYKQMYNTFAGSSSHFDGESMEIAAYIKTRTKPNEKIFAYTYGATFYEQAERKSGSKFVSASVILLDSKENLGFNFTDEFMNELENSQTKYIIVPISKQDVLYQNQKAVDYIKAYYKVDKVFKTRIVMIRK